MGTISWDVGRLGLGVGGERAGPRATHHPGASDERLAAPAPGPQLDRAAKPTEIPVN